MQIQNLGLFLNMIGTVLIAFSVGRFPKEFGGSTTGSDGKEYHFIYFIHPNWFKVGIALLIIGFLSQLILK